MATSLESISGCNTVWMIGNNQGGNCGDIEFGDYSYKLKLAKWSKLIQNVVNIDRGCCFKIYTIATPKNDLIFAGFIRESQNLLPYKLNSFYVIPDGVSLVCSQYFGYHHTEYYGAGYNGHKQLGINIDESEIPQITKIEGIENIHKVCIGASGWSIIWITNNGELYINGSSYDHQLATIAGDAIPVPTKFDFFKDKSLKCIDAAITSTFTMILCHDGSVWSCGSNRDFALGFENEQKTVTKYTKIEGLCGHKIKAVSVTENSAMFLEENGNLWSCGDNGVGQCGDDGQDKYSLPVKIKYFERNGIRVNKIDCGQQHVIVIDDECNIYCWGWNNKGQCGVDVGVDGDDKIDVPVLNELLSKKGVVDIRAGNQHSGCITKDGEYYVWGCNCENECCFENYDDENEGMRCLKRPKCVNEYVMECTKCEKIVDMTLSYCNTMFLVC